MLLPLLLNNLLTNTGAYVFNVGTGAYTYTGYNVGIFASRVLNVSTGSYSYTGFNFKPLASRVISITTGTYTYSLNAGGLTKLFTFPVGVGAYIYTLNSQPPMLKIQRQRDKRLRHGLKIE